jgi:protein-tyrosine phosphatase
MNTVLYWIDSPGPGRLGISARPRGGEWLEDEIEQWRRNGVDIIVSLLTAEEVETLDLREEAARCEAHSIRFLSFPIPDVGIPASKADAATLLATLRDALKKGRNVAVHCRQSVGRSGMITAALLTTEGMSPGYAMQLVSEARGIPVPETAEQRAWVSQFGTANVHS